jgi:hypothetical protein
MKEKMTKAKSAAKKAAPHKPGEFCIGDTVKMIDDSIADWGVPKGTVGRVLKVGGFPYESPELFVLWEKGMDDKQWFAWPQSIRLVKPAK